MQDKICNRGFGQNGMFKEILEKVFLKEFAMYMKTKRTRLFVPIVFKDFSNNHASDKPHWLRYCHCAKLGAGPRATLPDGWRRLLQRGRAAARKLVDLTRAPRRSCIYDPPAREASCRWTTSHTNVQIWGLSAHSLGMLGNFMQIATTSPR